MNRNQKRGDFVTVALENLVATVTIERPPVNFISVDLMRELADALEALDRDAACRAIVLASAGKAFCAGADLASSTEVGGAGMSGIKELYGHAGRLFSTATPIVAAVQGAAVGAGLGLALVADFRICSPEERFTANFVKLGFHPGFGITHTLPGVVGETRAALMCLTGRRVKPDEALAWGLVDQVVPAGELQTRARALAAEIAENAPLAIAATRRTLRKDLAAAISAQINLEYEQQSILWETEDFAEGVRAVNERRPGVFVGR
jgi:enoyl-CoA hydratase/carnithine racemase